ncbi:MAG TPA: hypothetical protein VN083_03205, partial [Vicinamibacteria bacterium]|nr:hypothetical protein [Vicinamibacteria bacterium]
MRGRVVPWEPRASHRPRKGEAETLRDRVRALEEELAHLRANREAPGAPGEGPLVALARLVQAGGEGLTWEALARVLGSMYFAWHSVEVDEFGYDPKFSDSLEPFFEFLYALWWRVETSGVEHVPGEGSALLVSNHSGVLPWDGLMIKVALR